MRNIAMTIPGMKWWDSMPWALHGLAMRIPRPRLGRRLCESVLMIGSFVLMAALTMGTIVLVVYAVAEAMAEMNTCYLSMPALWTMALE
jgi:hypothetical protein